MKQNKYAYLFGRYDLGLIALIILANAIRIYIAATTHFVSSDAFQFITLGTNFFQSGHFTSSYGIVPGWAQSPGFPFVIGLFSGVFGPETAARVAAEFFVWIIILLIYRFTVKYFDRSTALTAILFFSANPVTVYVYGRLISESLFVVFNFSLFILLYHLIYTKSLRWYRSIVLSLLFIAAYLTRSEGLLFGVAAFLFLIRYGKLKAGFFYLVFSSLLLFGYGIFVQWQSGTFRIAPKIEFNARVGQVTRLIDKEKTPDVLNISDIQEYAWYAYDPEINDLYSARIMDDVYFHNLKRRIDQLDPKSVNVQKFGNLLLNNITETIKVFGGSFAFPISFILLAILGGIFLYFHKREWIYWFALWNVASFYFLVSHVEYRFFYTMIPFFSILAALGILFISRKTKIKYLPVLFIILSLVNSGFYIYSYNKEQINRETLFATAEQLRDILPKQQRICVRLPHLTYWSNNKHVKLPVCTADELVNYLDAKQADALILGPEVFELRRTLLPVYRGEDGRFKEVAVLSSGTEIYKLFRKDNN